MKNRIIYISIIFFFVVRLALSDNIGIFVDGGFSPGSKETDMDKMLDKRIDDAMDNMKDKDPKSKRKKVDKKDSLVSALQNLHCKCGDTLTLMMIGHGSEDKFGSHAFEFIKEGRDLSPDDLLNLLKKAADECCCKINVVIFSCHSGAFLDKLFEDPHVISVYTSCTDKELSYSDAYYEGSNFIDDGDWIKGFNEDYKKSTKQNETDRIQEASETAKQKMPDEFTPKEHPQGWRRGELQVLGHVSERRKDGKTKKIVKLKVHFYNPEFLRCQTKEVDVGDVDVPDSVDKCKWVTFYMITGKPSDPLKADSNVTVVDPPTEKVLAHVEGVIDKKTLRVHIITPKWLYCNIIKLPVESPGVIEGKIQVCNWIDVKIMIKNPDDKDKGFSSNDTIKAKDQTFKCKVHVESIGNKEKGTVNIHILEPPWLNCQMKTITIPPDKLAGLDKCSNLVVNLTFHPDGTETASDVKKITNAEGAKKFSLDVSVQNPRPPVIDSTRSYQPMIGVTNTGLNTVSFPVYAVICKLSEKYLIENWWRTGEGEPTVGWHDVKNVSELPFAETRIVNFNTWHAPQGSDTYWLGFRTKLQGDENPASDTASTVFTVTQQPVNHPPVLTNVHVMPDSGTATTTFTYTVTYRDEDNDAPTVHQVFIDNSPFNMTGSGNYSEGVTFSYQTTLSIGTHTYSFRFDDGNGHPVNTQTYAGPIVSQGVINHAPVLQQGSVTPDSGNYYTPFVYRVLYIDQDNDPPTVYQAYIDNTPFNMTPQGNHFNEGVFFVLQRNLNPGNHTFYFRFDDGQGHTVTSQTYTGPIVH